MSPKPSYKRNHDYTRQFNWTYDLKRDVYNCYIKARENKSIGYMKRLKSYWDELHPGFSFLSDKNLRDVASRIALNKVVIDTEFDNTTSIATETDIVNNEVVEGVNCPVNIVNDQATNKTTVQHVPALSTTQEELLEVLRPIFERNYEIIKKQSIEERVYSTNCSKTLSDDAIKVISFISINKLNELIKPNFFDINVLYTAAVTVNEHKGDLKENTNQRPKTYNPQKWIISIENKINKLRKTIGQLTTVINCKKTKNLLNTKKH